ncbi:MAG: N-acetyl-gamma-glutamyl-phosphate reductase [Caldisericaceae bacterium]|nr:N-acetyl-gamma-glutamyl-phosphate reductase [Caldisericaceae bacterium]
MVKVGIVGGAGYAGGELLRILLHHPWAEIAFVHSRSQAGKPITSVHSDLFGETDLQFTDSISTDADLLFLSMGHGESQKILAELDLSPQVKIIDLSQDFRLSRPGNDFVYGLPEAFKEEIKEADKIANPGCFATAIQLALLPVAANGLLNQEVHVSAITGSTGAGQSLSSTIHYTWRNNNVSVYKPFVHQHLAEIKQTLQRLNHQWQKDIYFVPMRGSFTRGILVAVQTKITAPLDDLFALYQDFYQQHPFVFVVDFNPDVKQVVNTNKALLHLVKEGEQLLIISVIDNLIKGAAGQAVQNMNLMFGFEETLGLQLKPVAF